MSIDRYWEERLRAGFPVRDHALRTEGYDVRSWGGKTGQWPRAVARQSLFADYLGWHATVFLPEVNQLYDGSAVTPPAAATEFQFFVTIGPWLYIDGKEWHVKNYMVKKSERCNGEWVRVNSRRYFIRLVELDRHIQAFEANVGRLIRPSKERLIYT